MTTTTNTTTKTPTISADDLRSLASSITSFVKQANDAASEALATIVEQAVEQSSTIVSLYDAMNADHRSGKTDPKDLSFAAYWRAVTAAAKMVSVKLPAEADARKLWTIGRYGAKASTRQTFLRAAAKHGMPISLDGYVRFLGKVDDFTSKGELTEEAAERKRAADAKAREEKAVREAAKSSRPLAFDFSTLFPSDATSDADRVKFLMLLRQEIDMEIKAIAADMDSKAVQRATKQANTEIKRHKTAK